MQAFGVVWDKTKAVLRAGEYLTGHFAPAQTDLSTPGVLRWSERTGANLELIGDTFGWPAEFGDERYVIHGQLADGDEITLLDAMVRTTSFDHQLRRISSSTLALGAHIEPGHRWTRAIYSTANLSEWRADTGIKPSHPAPRSRPHDLRIDWRPPTRDEVRVGGAQLAFAGQSSTAIAYAPNWTIDTWQVVVVNADRPLTIDEY
jgi:ApeA N-terminal domain 1